MPVSPVKLPSPAPGMAFQGLGTPASLTRGVGHIWAELLQFTAGTSQIHFLFSEFWVIFYILHKHINSVFAFFL
jgi:hypothetical protein